MLVLSTLILSTELTKRWNNHVGYHPRHLPIIIITAPLAWSSVQCYLSDPFTYLVATLLLLPSWLAFVEWCTCVQ